MPATMRSRAAAAERAKSSDEPRVDWNWREDTWRQRRVFNVAGVTVIERSRETRGRPTPLALTATLRTGAHVTSRARERTSVVANAAHRARGI
eukprot:31194-Pelagococcus_subviridis.AAC.32